MIDLLRIYLRPYRRALVIVVILVLAQTIANLYLPNLMADIINRGIAQGDTHYILSTGGFMLLVTFLQAVCAVTSVYFGSRTAMAFGRDLRSVIFRTVESFSQREVNHFGTPSLITRNTNDVQQMQMLVVLALNMMLAAPIMLLGGVIMALREDVVLTSLIGVIVPLMAAVVGIMVWRVMPLFKAQQVKIDRVNQVMRENLSGMRVIRAFVRTRFERRRFDEANSDLTATALSINRTFALMLPLLFLIFNLSTVAIMWFGGKRVASGAMPIGNITAFLTYVMIILMSVIMAVFMMVFVPRAAASAERIQQVLQTEPSVIDPVTTNGVGEGRGFLEFDDVEFGYPGAEDPVLRHITFSAAPGEITAIVGSTGSGKSTLINLIPRLFDATGGRILVDGVDIRNMPRQRLWAKIGFVPQKAFLFSGTVASNLRYGKDDASEPELWHALTVAQAKDFVGEMSEQLEAPVTQGGASVSGGQRQRLAIARALVKRPEIYVFDDSFSALDFRTDAQLRAALKRETADATVLIVAQRVSTILNADRIIVLEDGTIAGMGTHDELMADCETYREIVYSQLSADEIA